jgi:hypothetical protein
MPHAYMPARTSPWPRRWSGRRDPRLTGWRTSWAPLRTAWQILLATSPLSSLRSVSSLSPTPSLSTLLSALSSRSPHTSRPSARSLFSAQPDMPFSSRLQEALDDVVGNKHIATRPYRSGDVRTRRGVGSDPVRLGVLEVGGAHGELHRVAALYGSTGGARHGRGTQGEPVN